MSSKLKGCLRAVFWIAVAIFLLAGCQQKMTDDGRIKPMEKSPFFEDGASARPLVEGTIPRGFLKDSSAYYTGIENGEDVKQIPIPVTRELIERGQQRFNIYCSVCHSRTGEGNGIVVQRGFTKPPSYFDDRLMKAHPGHFFRVMSNGFGDMASYRDVLDEHDRWAIVSYIRTLQRSHQATPQDVPEKVREKLKNAAEGQPVL